MGIGGVNKPSSVIHTQNVDGEDEIQGSSEAQGVSAPSGQPVPTDTMVSGSANPTPGVTAVGGAPSVSGAVNFDPEMANTTLQDVGNIGGVLGGNLANMSPEQVDALVAKLMVLFGSNEKDIMDQLVQNAEQERQNQAELDKAKAADMAELVDLANSNDCMAQQRLEDKLEDMGYSPEEASKLADQMTGKGVSPGQQAVMAMEAVENAPQYNQEANAIDGEKTTGGVVDSELLARLAEGENEDRTAMTKLLLMLVGADENSINGSKDGPDQPGEKSPAGPSGSTSAGGTAPTTAAPAMPTR